MTNIQPILFFCYTIIVQKSSGNLFSAFRQEGGIMKVLRNCAMSIRLVMRYAPRNALILILGFYIPGFFGGLQIILVQHIVDYGIQYVNTGEGLSHMILAGSLLVLMLFSWVTLQRVGSYENKLIETKITERMSPDIMDKLDNLEYSAFENQGAQEILQRISREPLMMITKCFQMSVITTQAFCSILFTLWVYMTISVWIGIGLLIITIPMILLKFFSASKQEEIYYKSTGSKRRMADLKLLLKNKHAVYEMKVFESQSLLSEKWNQYCSGIIEETKQASARIFLMDGASRMLSITYFIFVIVTLAYSLLHGAVTIGQFIAALGSIGTITSKMTQSLWQVATLMKQGMELDFFREFLAMPKRTDRGSITELSHYDIAFENVSFSYPGTDREILKNITFRVQDGESIAFVGENGAGKSTIIKLLCGLYEPTKGRVMIGGRPVRELSEKLRQQLVSVVFQDFQSYELTLRENIAFGSIDKLSCDSALLDALRLADASSLATSEEKGLDRNLGHLEQDGKDLSKGQWQRIAMARAFLSDARYMILDEPTASLDPIAESHMYENFSKIFQSRGTIMISHRLASAKMAKRIMVLDGGKIVQNGSHEELMAEEGLYRTMYLAQSSFYQEGKFQTAGGSL